MVMKTLTEFILEYRERRNKSFDYVKIKNAIKNCKPSFFGKNVCLDILWRPEIRFSKDGGWKINKKSKSYEYKGITLSESPVMFIDFYAEKKLFKKDVIEGYISWILPDKLNKDDTNCDELEKFLKSKVNDVIKDRDYAQERIKFTSYEELEKYLNEIEDIINKHNTKCDTNEPTYLFFDRTEATLNSQFTKHQYELKSCDEKISSLNKELEDIEKAAEGSDVDLIPLMDITKEKIEYFKRSKENLEK